MLRILERRGGDELVGLGSADGRRRDGSEAMDGALVGELIGCVRRRRSMSGLLTLVAQQPFFEECCGRGEFIAEVDEKVDVVRVFAAAEAVGEVVARVDGGAGFAAMGTLEAEIAFDHFGGRSAMAEVLDDDLKGKIVADATEEIGRNHQKVSSSRSGDQNKSAPPARGRRSMGWRWRVRSRRCRLHCASGVG